MRKDKKIKGAKRQLGNQGEIEAGRFLEEKGYIILERNWRHSKSEIDLIAKVEDILVFVEVKTITGVKKVNPEDVVSIRQLDLIAKAANVYMELIDHDWEVRFDLIIVTYTESQVHEIQHYEDVYFPSVF